MESNEAQINELTARFFDAFTNCDGAVPNVDCLHDIFVRQAIIVKNVNGEPVYYDVAGFIEPRRRILTDGTLTDFREAEVAHTTHIYGAIAQRFSRYAKSWSADGKQFEGAGTKGIQYLRTRRGWKICSLTWDDEPDRAVT